MCIVSVSIIIVAFCGLVFSAIAKRLHFSSELFLVLLLGVVSFVPFLERIQIDGHLLLELILPPMLFSAAQNLSGYKFRQMRNPILWLGVGLIFVTALVVALVVDALTGFMTFSAGLILGAVVAPPDAVSSVSIGKKLGLPDRVMTILTGESLINDAAALTLFTFAVGLTYGESSVIQDPFWLLVYTSTCGVGVGLVAGGATILVRKLLDDSQIIAVFTALMPWAIYIGAEKIHSSGVLAVVAAGFVIEKNSFRSKHTTRLQEQALWHSIETLIDSFVFAYIGLQLRFIISDLVDSTLSTSTTILSGFLVLFVVIAVRPFGVLGYNASRLIWYRMQYKHLAHFVSAKPYGKKMYSKASDRLQSAAVSWREYLILSWTGMRGVVTLAAASSIPTKFASDETFSHHSDAFKIHIFIQVVGLIVAIGTLLLQGLTLPILIDKLAPGLEKHSGKNPLDGQYGKARQIMENSALTVIDKEHDAAPDSFDKEHIINVWKSLDSVSIAKSKRDISFVSGLLIEIVETQREDIQRAAQSGDLHPSVAREFLNRLDLRLASYTGK